MGIENLIADCKKGDRLAQEALYRQFSPVLFGICLKYASDRMEAEDHLHDSFMTVFDKIGQFRSQGSFEGWIKRITVNTILQKYRKREFLTVVGDHPEDDADLDTEGDGLDLQTLLGYIQELPPKYRQTFNLYVLDGYSHKEIGALMGTTVGTSKSNLARARSILKEKIENQTTKSIIGLLALFLGPFF